jgi:RNA polymerase sigma-70 factor (ECF subfamily)
VDESAIRLQVDRARAGDVEALGPLFDVYRPDVLRLCTRMIGALEAEDAAHDAFQRAQHRLDRYDPSHPFRRWLLAITANHCIDRLRRRGVEKRLFDPGTSELEELAADGGSALDEVVQRREQSAVRDAVDRLPEKYRAPLVLRYFADLDYDSIAAELDLSRSQVATLLYRAKQRLRASLQAGEEADA